MKSWQRLKAFRRFVPVATRRRERVGGEDGTGILAFAREVVHRKHVGVELAFFF
jgi:hypothetical protein